MGGTGFNFGADFGRLDAYIASTDRMRKMADQNIDVLISNHSGLGPAQGAARPQSIRARGPDGPACTHGDEPMRPGAARPVQHDEMSGGVAAASTFA